MKIFIKKIVGFTLLVLLMSNSVFFINYTIVKFLDFSFDEEKEILILGDSNSKCAINDSIFNTSINLSGSADSYFYSFLKLNAIVEDDKNSFKTVFLSFSPHNIVENGWLYNEEDIVTRFPKYYPLMTKEDFKFLFKHKSGVFFASLARVFKDFPGLLKNKINGTLISDYGGFEHVDNSNLKLVLDKLSKNEPLPFFKLPNKFKISLQETYYLEKIVKLCQDSGLKLILMNPPKRNELLIHEKYFFAEFNDFYDHELSDIPFLDFSNFVLPDECYDDLVHLNYKGAKIFSTMLDESEIGFLLKNYTHK